MLNSNKTLLIIIDVQGKLAEVIHAPNDLFGNINRLTGAAGSLDIPILITEQLPNKLGPTRAELSGSLAEVPVMAKSSFSCCGDEAFNKALDTSGKRQILLCGIESHICVLQTALDLLERGFEVYVAADAVSSRSPDNKQLALERMRQHGAEIIATESALFEWLRDAAHPAFKEVRKFLA